jgi:hypothetical protein
VHASHASWKAATCQLVQQYQKACELQNIAVNPADTPANPGIQYRAKKMARAATLFTIRKLLP